MAMTLDEIRRKGLEVLQRELGRAGMLQFMQQFETGQGDYARERREWVDRMTLDDLRRLADKRKKPKKRPPGA